MTYTYPAIMNVTHIQEGSNTRSNTNKNKNNNKLEVSITALLTSTITRNYEPPHSTAQLEFKSLDLWLVWIKQILIYLRIVRAALESCLEERCHVSHSVTDSILVSKAFCKKSDPKLPNLHNAMAPKKIVRTW